MLRKKFGPSRFAIVPHVFEVLLRRYQTGLANDSFKLRPQVLIADLIQRNGAVMTSRFVFVPVSRLWFS